ncbi:1-acyl-sn-glycerol-3-phosphate acyltransferase [Asanoa ferruginea]|uniref:1-acyl-sn-glycerol-3-phosphate acyltransferase n=1 Tax=Asanoa ferruginea TaxID=53367 RepID=A0A3D9ZTW7_9ACTN|nr:lysophospholipid acyltransferase family protein [Asanoa ferruginea]REG00616.1 1-acyl-sn-glycerol-3-phosphate acyltransferase [Asanoa ferruginea]GIF47780.1 1-acyl-sn-glycerol-3-phosphate acyltransferase [Asanoa ferruginea]
MRAEPTPTAPATTWRPPRFWLFLQWLARFLMPILARVRVSGDVPEGLRHGPLILAANHISPFDPIVLTAATRVRRIAPRIMATGGLFRAPVVGRVMRAAGHIRVDRRTATVGDALQVAADAVKEGSVVMVYPEGRIGLDPTMWPERGKTGAARLAFASGAPVVPVAQWGSHEVVPYVTSFKGIVRGAARSMIHRPIIKVRFGAPIDLSDLVPGVPGSAQRATERIIEGLTTTLAAIRPDELEGPRFIDATRPVDVSRRYRRRP